MSCSKKAIDLSPSFTDQELHIAAALQQYLLPKPPAQLDNFEIEAYYRPANYLTGDCYDFVNLPKAEIGLFIADVSGKSLPAALIMTSTLTLFRSLAQLHSSPSNLLKELNHKLKPYLLQNFFVTACYAILKPKTRTLTLARAGHEAPLHSHASIVTPLRSPGIALGIDKGARFDSLITDSDVSLQSGDSVTFYTDGVNETLDLNNEEFGMERLKQTIQEAHAQKSGAQFILNTIVKTLDNYRNTAVLSDDLTLFTLYVR